MKRSKTAILIYILIGFAFIGLISQLFGNTVNFLVGILVMLFFAALLFGLLYFVMNRRNGTGNSDEMKKYKKAVKQSNMKYQQSAPIKKTVTNQKKKTKPAFRKERRRPTHLRVIEGNKDKAKDQATN
ncbi:SA1362 family protein [Oceanobacillus sp. CAU 1775]